MTGSERGRLGVFVSIAATVIGGIGFATHTTFTLGEIKGSLDRDLVQLRERQDDHEVRLRALELVRNK